MNTLQNNFTDTYLKLPNYKTVSGKQVLRTFTNGKIQFISFNTIIMQRVNDVVTVDSYYWDYSKTTTLYLSYLLNMNKSEIAKAIENNTILTGNLNR